MRTDMSELTNLAKLAQIHDNDDFGSNIPPPEYRDIDEGHDNVESNGLASSSEVHKDQQAFDENDSKYEIPDSVEKSIEAFAEAGRSFTSLDEENDYIQDADFDNYSEHADEYINDPLDINHAVEPTGNDKPHAVEPTGNDKSHADLLDDEQHFLNSLLATLTEENKIDLADEVANLPIEQTDDSFDDTKLDELSDTGDEQIAYQQSVNSNVNQDTLDEVSNEIEDEKTQPVNTDETNFSVNDSKKKSTATNATNAANASLNVSEDKEAELDSSLGKTNNAQKSQGAADLSGPKNDDDSLYVQEDKDSIIDRRLLSKSYMRGVVSHFFLHKSFGTNLCEINSIDGCLDINLRNNVSVKDYFNKFSVESDSPEESAAMAIKTAKMKGWKCIKVHGEPEYVQAMTIACKAAGIGVKLNRDYSNIAQLRNAAKNAPSSDPQAEQLNKMAGKPEEPTPTPNVSSKEQGVDASTKATDKMDSVKEAAPANNDKQAPTNDNPGAVEKEPDSTLPLNHSMF